MTPEKWCLEDDPFLLVLGFFLGANLPISLKEGMQQAGVISIFGKGRWLILFCGINFFKTRTSRWLFFERVLELTPWKINNKEPESFHPWKKENHLPIRHFQLPALNLPGWPNPYHMVGSFTIDLRATSAPWAWHEERPRNESRVLSQHPVGQHPIVHRFCHLVTWWNCKGFGHRWWKNHLQIWGVS